MVYFSTFITIDIIICYGDDYIKCFHLQKNRIGLVLMFQKQSLLILFGTISLSWTRIITQTSSDNVVTSKNYLLG